MRKKLALSFSLLALAFLPGYEIAQQKALDVPYVPTKYPVVDEMLRMAKLTKNDIVYDLGCGDGRLVVGAAQKYGARGVGFDIDPERIKECHENAAKAGVTNLVKFHEQDLFTADFHEATAMTIYLLTSVNLKLRPKLLRELRPGTRLVSHNFGMGDWKPDDSSTVMVDEIDHEVFMWIIPANISGTWTWNSGKPAAPGQMDVRQSFQMVNGSAKAEGRAVEMRDLSLKGDQVRFVMDRPYGGKTVSMVYEGRVSGNSITGTIRFQNGGKDVVWEWKANRKLGTEKPIDEEPSKTAFSLRKN